MFGISLESAVEWGLSKVMSEEKAESIADAVSLGVNVAMGNYVGAAQDALDLAGVGADVGLLDGGNTSGWSASQWLEAMERNPEKYMKEFARAKAEGTLSDSAEEAAAEIMQIGKQELDSRMEGRLLASNLSAMDHQMNMQIIGNIRG